MIVIKFGGHAMTDTSGTFAEVIKRSLDKEPCVIVHGGGPQIDAALKTHQLDSTFVGGFRVTTPEIFAIVQQVLSGTVLREVVGHLRAHDVPAVGISGRDGGTLQASILKTLVDGTTADLGRVGEVERVDTALLKSLLDSGFTPVVSPIAVEFDGAVEVPQHGLNVNADLAAAAIAGALDATSLIFMTDVPGIYRNWPDRDSLINEISAAELEKIKSEFDGGMAPKVKASLDAIAKGAKVVRIIDGRDPKALDEALSGVGGTKVYA
ncbi:MAG: acetylglutamate kinase [Candidatus Nanopelagicaceae bacterium]|jgi:acetylglutamate kinase